MSYNAKNKYEVLKILRASILQGLSAFGMADMQCMEFAQPLLQSADKVVLIKQTGQKRVGWQRARYKYVTPNGAEVQEGTPRTGEERMIRTEAWIEEQSWEVTVVLKRDGSKVTGETKTSEDVAFALIAWFNSTGGIEVLRSNDCANLFINPASVSPYKDDSQLYQNTSTFTVEIQVPKEFDFEQPMADPVYKGMKGV